MKRFLSLALSPLLLCAAAPAPVAADPIFGVWGNPARTIAVRIAACGQEICGTIVEATAKAEQDARAAGVNTLIGVELLKDYRQTAPTRWSGTVYVPDMGRSFSSHIVAESPNSLRIAGCLVGGFLCKSQVWTRL
ncbi:DUF2147 domain-containing protein [Sphingomonas sp. CJ20]